MTQVELLQQTGYHRRRNGAFDAPAREVRRLHALRIPPAWKNVAVARSPQARLQAVGRDKKGRWQYRYSEKAVRQRESRKYARLVAFGAALPRLRAYIDSGLRKQGLPPEKIMAAVLRILSTCFMRPGSEIYAKENGSFGIATLQNRHATVSGDTVRFHYIGKSGQEQIRELKDRRVARVVRQLKKLPGKEIFPVTRQQINDTIKDVMGERFSAKDFRTWAGTLIAACALKRLNSEVIEGRTERRKLIVAAVKETAAQLGNTPAVCKTSYIWPPVLTRFESGLVLGAFRGERGAERALLRLLRNGSTLH